MASFFTGNATILGSMHTIVTVYLYGPIQIATGLDT